MQIAVYSYTEGVWGGSSRQRTSQGGECIRPLVMSVARVPRVEGTVEGGGFPHEQLSQDRLLDREGAF